MAGWLVAEVLTKTEYQLVEQRLLCGGIGSNESFGTVMERVAPQQPDAFMLTAYSAVPLADTLRGYYDASGYNLPEIHYVKADTSTSRSYSERPRIIAEETSRLKALQNIGSICIIDQYSVTGQSLRLAEDIAGALNIKQIIPVAGRWYHNAFKEDVFLKKMSSKHSDLMYEVGQKAAALSLAATQS